MGVSLLGECKITRWDRQELFFGVAVALNQPAEWVEKEKPTPGSNILIQPRGRGEGRWGSYLGECEKTRRDRLELPFGVAVTLNQPAE